jgi:hypothetical protein
VLEPAGLSLHQASAVTDALSQFPGWSRCQPAHSWNVETGNTAMTDLIGASEIEVS